MCPIKVKIIIIIIIKNNGFVSIFYKSDSEKDH